MNREPAIAGSFYPADPDVLKTTVQDFISNADETGPAPKAMIVPHAGYIYSGPVAAHAYARLKSVRDSIKRVVLLGPTHRVPVRGIATVSVDNFSTPLGDIPIDQQSLSLIRDLPQVTVSDVAHAQEHSLEVHLPFLQTCLEQFSLVPLAVGDTTPEAVAEVLDKLWGGNETLIVISSDLSHFHDYQSAWQRDLNTSDNIVALRYDKLTYEDACGRMPVSGLLYHARKHGFGIDMIDLRNSGDTAGDKSRVVGYGCYVLTPPKHFGRFTANEGNSLLSIAEQSIQHGVQTGQPQRVNISRFPQALRQQRATFVTINKHGALRGCIGTLQARRPIIEDVTENAFAAAFRDPRFAPVTENELDDLEIHLSILSEPRPMTFQSEDELINQIRPGKDGLILEDSGRRGTFLPSVWETLPDRMDFWRQLKLKAGLPPDHWSDSIKVSRYETQYFP